jgi:hypothetical protein
MSVQQKHLTPPPSQPDFDQDIQDLINSPRLPNYIGLKEEVY